MAATSSPNVETSGGYRPKTTKLLNDLGELFPPYSTFRFAYPIAKVVEIDVR